MDKQEVRDRVLEIGIVPVVRAPSPGEARIAAAAVCQGGIPIVEITMTVLNAEAARRCLDAGAQFLVSPGLNLKTVELAVREGKLIMAGALTPTEVITAWEAGADFVKIFPCGQVGGAKYIKALKGPLPQIPLVPTGGVNLSTAACTNSPPMPSAAARASINSAAVLRLTPPVGTSGIYRSASR